MDFVKICTLAQSKTQETMARTGGGDDQNRRLQPIGLGQALLAGIEMRRGGGFPWLTRWRPVASFRAL